MKIAIFSDTLYPRQVNGVAKVALQSGEILEKLGHRVMIVSPASLPSIPAIVYPGERLAIPISMSEFRKLKAFRPDIIHSHTPFMIGWAAVIAKKFLKAKLVGTHHTFYDNYLKHAHLDYPRARKLSWQYTVWHYNFCDLVTTPSQALADELIKQGLTAPITVLRNPIQTDFFKPASPEQRQALRAKFRMGDAALIYMGRVSYEKSIDQVIRAFEIVAHMLPRATLHIVGDGPERAKLEALAHTSPAVARIVFTGHLAGAKLLEPLQAADVFLTACKNENMPLSVLEAMASGLPVVAVPERGLAEFIHDGDNGCWARTDDPQSMAELAMDILHDPVLRETMSCRSREIALQYSYQEFGRNLEHLYENLIVS